MPRPTAHPRRVAHTVFQNSAVTASSANARRISLGGGNQRDGSHSNLAATSNTTSTTATPGGAQHPTGEPRHRPIGGDHLTPSRRTSPIMARVPSIRLHPEQPGRGRGIMTSIRTGSWQIRVLMALMVVSIVAACGGDGGTATTAGGTDTTGAVSDTTAAAGSETTAGASGDLTPLAVGVIPITDVVPLYIAIEEGLFEEAGLEVTPTLAEGGAAIIPGVEAGEFQIGFSNVVSLVNATAAGIQLQALTGGMKANEEAPDWSAVLVGADSDIQEPADLAGRTIAVNTLANIGEVTIRASLRRPRRGYLGSSVHRARVPRHARRPG